MHTRMHKPNPMHKHMSHRIDTQTNTLICTQYDAKSLVTAARRLALPHARKPQAIHIGNGHSVSSFRFTQT